MAEEADEQTVQHLRDRPDCGNQRTRLFKLAGFRLAWTAMNNLFSEREPDRRFQVKKFIGDQRSVWQGIAIAALAMQQHGPCLGCQQVQASSTCWPPEAPGRFGRQPTAARCTSGTGSRQRCGSSLACNGAREHRAESSPR